MDLHRITPFWPFGVSADEMRVVWFGEMNDRDRSMHDKRRSSRPHKCKNEISFSLPTSLFSFNLGSIGTFVSFFIIPIDSIQEKVSANPRLKRIGQAFS